MANIKSNSYNIGVELSGNQLFLSAISDENLNVDSTQKRKVRTENVTIPDSDEINPSALPSTAILAPVIKNTLSKMGISKGSVSIAMDSTRMILRYFIGTQDHIDTELKHATERSINYLQLGVGDRLTGEYVHAMNDSRKHASLGISSASVVDPLIDSFEKLGLRVQVVEPSLVALVRIMTLADCLHQDHVLIVFVNQEGFEMGVASDGQLLFSRRPMVTSNDDIENQMTEHRATLPRELEKTFRHYSRTFGISESLHRVILCGRDDQVIQYKTILEQYREYETDQFSIDETICEHLQINSSDIASDNAYTVALGTACGLQMSRNTVVGPNVTSEPDIQQRSILEEVFRACILPTLLAVGIWAIVNFAQNTQATAVSKLRIQVEHPSMVEAKHRELQMQVMQSQKRASNIQELGNKLKNKHWSDVLEMIRICVPDRLWIRRFRQISESQMTIDGTAYDESLVYDFSKYLEDSPLLENVNIITTTSARDVNVIITEFSLECSVTSDNENTELPSP